MNEMKIAWIQKDKELPKTDMILLIALKEDYIKNGNKFLSYVKPFYFVGEAAFIASKAIFMMNGHNITNDVEAWVPMPTYAKENI